MGYGLGDFYNQFIAGFPTWLYETVVNGGPFKQAGKTISEHTDYKKQIKDFMESPWNEDKYARYLFYRSNEITAPFIKAYEAMEDNRQYMANYGLDWDGVKFVWRLPGTEKLTSSVSSMRSFGGLNFVSRNIERLYK